MTRKVLILIVIVTALYVAHAYVWAYFMKREVARVMESSLATIARPWDQSAVLKRGSLALKASPTEPLNRKINAANVLLGRFLKLNDQPNCTLSRGLDTYSKREYTYASCSSFVTFEKRTMGITMRLVWQENEWLIDKFTMTEN